MAASASVAEVAGFGISGWMVQILTGPYAVLADAFSFLASAGALIAIGKPEPEPRPAEGREGVRKEILEGGRTIAHSPILRSTLTTSPGSPSGCSAPCSCSTPPVSSASILACSG